MSNTVPLLAKTKGKKGSVLKFSDIDPQAAIWGDPDVSKHFSLIPYSPSDKPDSDELFFLDSFLSRKYPADVFGKFSDTANLPSVQKDDMKKIDYLSYEIGSYTLFQRIMPSQLIYRPWYDITGLPQLKMNKKILVMREQFDALYDKTQDKLYFRKLENIKSIFNNIEDLFKTATNQEVQVFISGTKVIKLEQNFKLDDIKTMNRKRISIVSNIMNSISPSDKNKIISKIKIYCPNIPSKNNTFIISNEEDLKNVLYGIEERYFTTEVGKKKKLASAFRDL